MIKSVNAQLPKKKILYFGYSRLTVCQWKLPVSASSVDNLPDTQSERNKSYKASKIKHSSSTSFVTPDPSYILLSLSLSLSQAACW